jgi:hypothetical protein
MMPRYLNTAMTTKTEQRRLERLLLGQEQLLAEAHCILAEEQSKDDVLRAVVLSSTTRKPVHNAIADADPARIFSEAAIRELCMKYRLRFLDSGLFKGELPDAAVVALRRLEQRQGAPMRGFKILAPTERFKLCDSEVDPMLFVPLGNGRHYLVHRWGGELNPLRSTIHWPLRTPAHLALTVFMLATVLAFAVPNSMLIGDPEAPWWGWHRGLFLVWTSMVFASFTLFGWFAFFGQFSSQAWNSRYFNG